MTTAFGASSPFQDLGFSISDYHAFAYEISVAPGACGVTSPGAVSGIYSFEAYGDLDGDAAGTVGANTSQFELAVGLNAANEMFRARGFYVTRELE